MNDKMSPHGLMLRMAVVSKTTSGAAWPVAKWPTANSSGVWP